MSFLRLHLALQQGKLMNLNPDSAFIDSPVALYWDKFTISIP